MNIIAATLRLSVIIPTYRDGDRLRTCLRALSEQSLPPENFEIIVINNDPTGSVPDAWLPSNARLVEENRPGSYAARNTGARFARGQILAFTDGDCVPDLHWAEHALAKLETEPGSRLSGPIVIFREPEAGHLAYLYEFHTAFRQKENASWGKSTTANLFVPKAVFDAVGPFSSDLLSGGDMVWNTKAQQLGVPLVFAEEVVVHHPARGSLRAIFAKRRRTARSEAIFDQTATWRYVRRRVKPPIDGRFKIDRAPLGKWNKAALFAIMWGLNLYGAAQFTAVRLGLQAPTRR